MRPALLILAFVGISAILLNLGRALFSLARRGVDAYLAGQTADVRARRGDLTGLEEAERRAGAARRSRVRAVAGVLGWGALLLGPLFSAWALEAYAVASVLWLLRPPGSALVRRVPRRDGGAGRGPGPHRPGGRGRDLTKGADGG